VDRSSWARLILGRSTGDAVQRSAGRQWLRWFGCGGLALALHAPFLVTAPGAVIGGVLTFATLAALGSRFEAHDCFVSVQGPVRIVPRSVPEPDASVVLGKLADYRRRHAGPADVCSVIEVADSSLLRDRTIKLAIYAAAGVSQYVIVNLVDRQVEVHTGPRVSAGEPQRAWKKSGSVVAPLSRAKRAKRGAKKVHETAQQATITPPTTSQIGPAW
jgi:hypothetical protein